MVSYGEAWNLRETTRNEKTPVDMSTTIARVLAREAHSIKRKAGNTTNIIKVVDTKTWKNNPIPGFTRGAVHVGKEKTIEVRIFKSSATKTNFLRKLEFVHAAVRFANSDVSLQSVTYRNFIESVLDKTNKKEYPYLINWLFSKKYIERRVVESPKSNKKYYRYNTINS